MINFLQMQTGGEGKARHVNAKIHIQIFLTSP